MHPLMKLQRIYAFEAYTGSGYFKNLRKRLQRAKYKTNQVWFKKKELDLKPYYVPPKPHST